MPSIATFNSAKQLQLSIEQSMNANSNLQLAKNDLKTVNEILAGIELDASKTGIELLNFTDNELKNFNKTKVVSMPEKHVHDFDKVRVITNKLVIQGMFSELIKLTSAFERNYNKSNLSSVQFEKVTDRQTKQTKLYATYFFQNIEQIR